ncbi:hypothetical protein PHISCL_11296, partial [Aspergillus sclerotialis]
MLQQQQQQQMQREQGDVDMNGRASSPAEGENGGSPSKRPRNGHIKSPTKASDQDTAMEGD